MCGRVALQHRRIKIRGKCAKESVEEKDADLRSGIRVWGEAIWLARSGVLISYVMCYVHI